MKNVRKLNRRSFLAQVAGGAVGLGSVGIIGGGTARAQTGPYTGVTDNDSGSHADNAGHGRGPGGNASGQQQQRPQTGHTDRDPSDPVGAGRGTYTGYSDSDSGTGADRSGHGRRGNLRTGLTDSDSYDRGGEGRGSSGSRGYARPSATRPDGTCVVPTGHTDSDSGQVRDPSGYGHGGSPGINFCYHRPNR